MKWILSALAILALVLVLFKGFSSEALVLPVAFSPAPVSALYDNGQIYTADPEQPWAEALVSRADRIVFVGTSEGAAAYTDAQTQRFDLRGRFVMPGIIDSHTHPGLIAALGGEPATQASMPAKPKQAILDWLQTYADENPLELMIMQGSWDVAEFQPDGPSKQDLDEIFPYKPVLLFDNSGHSTWANSALLTLAGVDKDTPALSENISYFVKDEQGEPTGWIKEFALIDMMQDLLLPDEALLGKRLIETLYFFSSKGVTTLYDAGNFKLHDEFYALVSKLDRAGVLPIHIEGTYHIFEPSQIDIAREEILELRRKYAGGRLQFNTVKIHYDGVTEITTAGMLDPYVTEPDNRGGVLFSVERLTDFILELDQAKLNLHLHAVGDRAARNILDAVETAQSEKGGELVNEVSISHLETVHPDDMPRFTALGVHANFTPHWFGGSVFGAAGSNNLGPERASRSQVVGAFFEHDANVTFSSDTVTGDELHRSNPFIGIEMSMTRREYGAGPKAPVLSPANAAVSLEQALIAYTRNGAAQLGIADTAGVLQPGAQADFVVLDANPFEVEIDKLHRVSPAATVSDGQLVYGNL